VPLESVLVLLLAGSLSGPAAPGTASAECPGGRITSIFVDAHSVFDLSDPDEGGRFQWALRTANRLHVRTRDDVILRELLVREGDCYDAARLEESARQLRAASFIADADVFGVRQPDGNWHVVVDTRDEWSTRLNVRVDSRGGARLEGFRLTEENLLGSGRRVSVFSTRVQGERTSGVSYFSPQLFASRWTTEAALGTTPTGQLLSAAVTRPFQGEGSGWAARQHVRHHDRYFQYVAPGEHGPVHVLLPEERRRLDLGGMVRFGRPGNLTIVGAGLVGDWSRRGVPEPADPERPVLGVDPTGVLEGLDSLASVRFEVLAGKRNVQFVRTRGVNSLRGSEDLRLGGEIEMGVGRSIAAFSGSDDLSLHLGTYLAGWLPLGALGGVRGSLEGRRDHDAPADQPEWRDLLGQAEGWLFWRRSPAARSTWVGSISAAGGWRTTLPFQLTLGADAGLRGYPRAVHAAGRRVVSTVEWRSFLGGPYPELLDLGTAVFLDVGRSWAGDAPFAVDSRVLMDAGIGLRAAFPPGARGVYRMDVAVPLQGADRFRAVRVTLGTGHGVLVGSVADDPQLRRSIRRGVTASLFNYPH
jgi:hypothetical protein